MILRNSLAMLAAGVTLLVGTQVAAVPITINNPGFEDPAQADGGFTTGLITGPATAAASRRCSAPVSRPTPSTL